MNSNESSQQAKNLWTFKRAVLTLASLALIATFGVSGCNSTDKSAGNQSAGGNSNGQKITMTVNGKPVVQGDGTAAPSVPPPVQMLPASALDTALKTVDGKPFKLSELKGKVLLIDLWATWCGPCRFEVPELVKMQSELGTKGFEVIGLDIDPESDTAQGVQDFMKKYSVNYKVAFADRTLAASLMKGGNIPQSLVVSRDGKIVMHFIGFSPNSTPQKMRQAIEQALQ